MEIFFYILLLYHTVAFAILVISYFRTTGLPLCSLKKKPRVSIMIPARDEEENLPPLLESLLRQDYPDMEILIYDDMSSDGTWRVIEEFSRRDSRIKGIRGKEKPEGWVGKNYALHVLSRIARGDIFVFMDADVRLRDRHLISRIVCNMADGKVITGFLRYRGGGTFVLTVLSYLYFQIPFPVRGGVNGQLWSITASDYRRLNPHEMFKGEVLEDVKIGYWLQWKGVRVDFRRLSLYADVIMYRSFCETIRGLTKNAWRAFLHFTPFAALGYWAFYLLPFVLMFIFPEFLLVSSIIMVGKFLSDRILLAKTSDTLLTPIGIFFFGYVMLRSWIFALMGKTRWKGRAV